MKKKTDVVIVGTGAAGLFCALKLPSRYHILMITKDDVDRSDSFLAQGGICMLRGEEDYESYFEDTMKAGHYENDRDSVDVMLRSSQDVIQDLIRYGVEFEQEQGELAFTREGGHSRPRILFHADVTGKEITGKLLKKAQERDNITIREHTMMLDILCENDCCRGVVIRDPEGKISAIEAEYVVLASGGLGGLYRHSTNFRHITGDALAVALRHGIELQHIDYIQIHPTTLYSEKPGRRFLISESVRGEGAILLNRKKERFVDELLPRDVVTKAIHRQMEEDDMPYVWLSLEKIPEETIRSHFPNIYRRCLEEGYDVTKEYIPVVPAQHYFMGGIRVDLSSRTSMEGLYAVGETSCNGVHGKNRLASNSLLESMVFAGRAAAEMERCGLGQREPVEIEKIYRAADYEESEQLEQEYHKLVRDAIDQWKN